MTEKAYITSSNMITFTCPECSIQRVVSIAEYNELEKAEKVRIHCRHCDHKYRVIIERRRQYRKPVNFHGTYVTVCGHPKDKGYARVIDLSRTGMKLRLNKSGDFSPGDILVVEFRLDDANRSLIKKEVEVKIVSAKELGVKFTSVHPSDPSDKALGFYMFG